jgi:SET domain-containing protein
MFATEDIPAGFLLEVAPVIVLPAKDRPLLDQTLLHDYIFEWGENREACAMALGFVPVYNHRSPSNCEYEMDYAEKIIRIRTVRPIAAGEELFINYNGDFDDPRPVWFAASE